MKFITILGSVFLTALQASASPLDVAGTPQELAPVHELEARDGWCCVSIDNPFYAINLPRGSTPLEFPVNGCTFRASRSATSCDGWRFDVVGICDVYRLNTPAVAPAVQCSGRLA
ncbi:hypothetical protein E4U54_000822 [Claviceps lovelessii]|nr:hypothetical protein E4U54_000822 [Claviceps lovelessii]